jgi:protease-4
MRFAESGAASMNDEPNPTPPEGRPPVSTAAASPPPPPPPGYLPPAYPAPPKQKGIISKVVTSLVATLVILSILLNVYLGMIVYSLTAGASESVYREAGTSGVEIESDDRVVIVPVEGAIDDDMARTVKKAFRSLTKKPPAAVVLRINSGGGGVTASDQIWHTVSQFMREHPDVAVVASLGAVAASGGYYIAAPCDLIVCEQTGITGSIGVMAQIPSVEGMIEKLGVEMNVVVAEGSERKAIANNLFEDWKDESGNLTPAGEQNREVLLNLLNSAWARFVEVVDEGRESLSLEQVEALATGDIFTAQEAVDNGLVNEIGYLDDAIDRAIELSSLPADAQPKVTIIRQSGGGLLSLLGARSSPAGGLGDLSPQRVRSWLDEVGQVRLAYTMQVK